MVVAGIGAGVARGLHRRKESSRREIQSRAELLANHSSNHFYERGEIISITLTKTWHEHSVTVSTIAVPNGRIYQYKPALNKYEYVRGLVVDVFGESICRFNP